MQIQRIETYNWKVIYEFGITCRYFWYPQDLIKAVLNVCPMLRNVQLVTRPYGTTLTSKKEGELLALIVELSKSTTTQRKKEISRLKRKYQRQIFRELKMLFDCDYDTKTYLREWAKDYHFDIATVADTYMELARHLGDGWRVQNVVWEGGVPRKNITYEELRDSWDDIERDKGRFPKEGLWPRGFRSVGPGKFKTVEEVEEENDINCALCTSTAEAELYRTLVEVYRRE